MFWSYLEHLFHPIASFEHFKDGDVDEIYKENNRWRSCPRFPENLSYSSFGFSDKFVEKLQ